MNYLTSFTEKDSTEDIVKALKSDGGVIIERLVPEEVMDEAYQDVQNNVSQAEQSSSTSLWPEGNRTVGGLAAASLTYTEKLVIHPKTLEIVDAMLMPIGPCRAKVRPPRPNQKSWKSETAAPKLSLKRLLKLTRIVITTTSGQL